MDDSEVTWSDVAPWVAGVLGVGGASELSEPVALDGSGRSHVWRVRAPGASYVVKVHLSAEDTYAREASALEALADSDAVPGLLAADDATRAMVMTDLGQGGDLADALLGDDPDLASTRLDGWVDAVARLHRASTPAVLDRFGRGFARRAPGAEVDGLPEAIGLAVERYRQELPALGVDPGVAYDELAALPGRLSPARVLSPSDACPDNNVHDGERLRLIDFEGAQVWNPAWDVAYLQVPWATCWCAWRIPDDVADRAVARYRAAATSHLDLHPDLDADLELTTLAWSVVSPGWFLPRALRPEPGDGDEDPRIPSRRAMVQHRLRRAAQLDGPAPLVDLAARLHEALVGRWGEHEMPLAPAWRPAPRPADAGGVGPGLPSGP